MSITRRDPGTIYLGGPRTEIGDIAASEDIPPGFLVEAFNSSGTWRYRKSTLTDKANTSYATEASMLNRGVKDSYAAGDLMEVTVGASGTSVWAWIASGANIAFGDYLSDAGNGKLKALASGVAIAKALETRNNTTGSLAPSTLPTGTTAGDARIRVEVL